MASQQASQKPRGLNFFQLIDNIPSIMENLRYIEHHVDRVEYWSNWGTTPEDVARELVRRFNTPIIGPREHQYPETPQFLNAVARLVEAYRNGEEIEILDDWKSDIYFDPMCNACRHCDNPVRDLQLRLPGFEDI